MVFQEKLSKIEERPLRKFKILMVDKNWLYYNEMLGYSLFWIKLNVITLELFLRHYKSWSL